MENEGGDSQSDSEGFSVPDKDLWAESKKEVKEDLEKYDNDPGSFSKDKGAPLKRVRDLENVEKEELKSYETVRREMLKEHGDKDSVAGFYERVFMESDELIQKTDELLNATDEGERKRLIKEIYGTATEVIHQKPEETGELLDKQKELRKGQRELYDRFSEQAEEGASKSRVSPDVLDMMAKVQVAETHLSHLSSEIVAGQIDEKRMESLQEELDKLKLEIGRYKNSFDSYKRHKSHRKLLDQKHNLKLPPDPDDETTTPPPVPGSTTPPAPPQPSQHQPQPGRRITGAQPLPPWLEKYEPHGELSEPDTKKEPGVQKPIQPEPKPAEPQMPQAPVVESESVKPASTEPEPKPIKPYVPAPPEPKSEPEPEQEPETVESTGKDEKEKNTMDMPLSSMRTDLFEGTREESLALIAHLPPKERRVIEGLFIDNKSPEQLNIEGDVDKVVTPILNKLYKISFGFDLTGTSRTKKDDTPLNAAEKQAKRDFRAAQLEEKAQKAKEAKSKKEKTNVVEDSTKPTTPESPESLVPEQPDDAIEQAGGEAETSEDKEIQTSEEDKSEPDRGGIRGTLRGWGRRLFGGRQAKEVESSGQEENKVSSSQESTQESQTPEFSEPATADLQPDSTPTEPEAETEESRSTQSEPQTSEPETEAEETAEEPPSKEGEAEEPGDTELPDWMKRI